MTHREFHRRVVGVPEQNGVPEQKTRARREDSPRRSRGQFLEIAFVIFCVSFMAEVAIDAGRLGATHNPAPAPAAVSEVSQATVPATAPARRAAAIVAPTRIAKASKASAAHHVPASKHPAAPSHVNQPTVRASRDTSLVGNAEDLWQRAVEWTAERIPDDLAADPTGALYSAGERIIDSLQDNLGASYATVDASHSADGAPRLDLPVLAGMGSFATVLALCLGAVVMMSVRSSRRQRRY